MRLDERFSDMTEHELRRGIELRQRLMTKAESEIRAIQKLLRKKTIAALPDSLNPKAAVRAKAS